MSSSIAIPKRRRKQDLSAASPSSSSAASEYSYGSFDSAAAGPAASPRQARERRQSLMSPAFSRAEHTVINVGNTESPRLITCVKTSQGFDWNLEIFLPSYADYHFDDLERKQDPVQDIVVTDEERANMFPS